jgi:hypothetical protein
MVLPALAGSRATTTRRRRREDVDVYVNKWARLDIYQGRWLAVCELPRADLGRGWETQDSRKGVRPQHGDQDASLT